jgi:hypothetical protein
LERERSPNEETPEFTLLTKSKLPFSPKQSSKFLTKILYKERTLWNAVHESNNTFPETE